MMAHHHLFTQVSLSPEACLLSKLLSPCPPWSLKLSRPWELSTGSLERWSCMRRRKKMMATTAPARQTAMIAWNGLVRLSALWPRMPWLRALLAWTSMGLLCLWPRVCVQLQAGADGVEHGHHSPCCLSTASCQGCKEGWDQEY